VTPSLGSFLELKKAVDLPIFIMIANPEADHTPPEADFQAMIQDVLTFADHGANGFVFACLTPDHQIDIERNKALLQAAQNRPCTFHRAFDTLANPVESSHQIADLGFKRILTSGCPTNVDNGLAVLAELLQNAPIQILPGGGVRAENAAQLKDRGATELHFSIRKASNKKGYLDYPLPELDPARITQMRAATN
jgi:copper homeostasis protein